MSIISTVSKYFSLVKFSHTIFALPFAMIGFFLGFADTGSSISWKLLMLVLLCMVFARSAAMGFNRYIDRKYDEKNPRTAKREIPAGIIPPVAVLTFVIINITAFIITTYFINRLCFFLSPVAMIVVLGYSFTKRFTSLCHVVLGLGLSLAPIGAYIAVTSHFALYPVLYSFAVICWVSGFDIFYALQDIEFDKSLGLRSIPARLGVKRSLWLSAILHLAAAFFIVFAGIEIKFGLLYWMGTVIFIALLLYEHLIVKPSNLRRVNQAFALLNGIASVIFGLFVIAELIINKIVN